MKKTEESLALAAFCIILSIMPLQAADYTLKIFGNANMDETIDEADIEYIQGIIDGTNEATQFSDANYDGEIDDKDIAQIQQIEDGTETELTLTDSSSRTVTLKMPITRIVPLFPPAAAVVRSLDAGKKVVGATEGSHHGIKSFESLFPEFVQLPSIGTSEEPDLEKIITIQPDLVLSYTYYLNEDFEKKLNASGIALLYLNYDFPPTFSEEVRQLGYILGKTDESEVFLNWYEGILDDINAKVEGMAEENKPKVFMCWGDGQLGTAGRDNMAQRIVVTTAGGINIGDSLPGDWITADPEWILKENPSIIVAWGTEIESGYETDDSSEAADMRNEIMERPGFRETDAARNGHIYIFKNLESLGCDAIAIAYMAKLFYPNELEDLDPVSIHQEYLNRFQHIDYDLSQHGVFLYPELSSSAAQNKS